mgnify:CR=1 FL=1
MKELFLLKLGEIVLKGQNRRVFEDKLKTVTRRRMAKFGTFKVSIVQSTLYVEPQTDDCDLDGAWEACGTIFGVAQMCRCRACEKDLDAIFAAVCDYLGDELSMARSFKVESKRSDKRFPLNSIQISQEIGGRLADFCILTADNPRFEKNEDIIKDIEIGMAKTSGKYMVIPDRKEAILYAVRHAETGDMIAVIGKGHEDYQIIGTVKHHFDDREAAAEELDAL